MTRPELPTDRQGQLPPVAGASTAADRIAPGDFGVPREVASGVWWIRLPLATSINHVNVYVLDDGEQWTLIDTGHNSTDCRWSLKLAFSQGPLSTKPLGRVIATHYHHDHIGLAGELAERGASLWTTRTAWLTAQLLQGDETHGPSEALVRFAQSVGLSGTALDVATSGAVNVFPRLVTPLPTSFHRIVDGDVVVIGNRRWTVTTCDGHAAENAMLWSDDGLIISGDQVLHGLTARVAVHHFEPDADPVGDWLAGMQRIAAMGDDRSLVLPGHHLPFSGISARCRQILASYHAVLNRLLDLLGSPLTAVACLEPIYRRPVSIDETLGLAAEMAGYLHFLANRGLVQRISGPGNAYLWRRIAARRPAALTRFDVGGHTPSGRVFALDSLGPVIVEGVRQ